MADLITDHRGEPAGVVATSIFELFKIGPGPSSSHTLGPMKMGLDFRRSIEALPPEDIGRAGRVVFRLFGSLSATGKGHGTDRALVAGFLGQEPETCPPDFLQGLFTRDGETHDVAIGGVTLPVGAESIVCDAVAHDRPWSNTVLAELLDADGKPLFQREYYSVGGGFIEYQGCTALETGEPKFAYGDMQALKKHLTDNNLRLHELVLINEQAQTGASRKDILAHLDRVIGVMANAVARGLETEGPLPGPIGLARKAPAYLAKAKKVRHAANKFLLTMNAAAHSAAEENAAGHVVVTAPTSGSAGVMPAVLHMLSTKLGAEPNDLRKGLLASAAVGFLVKHNAGIAGAEMGCQGEIGTASAMAAAALCYARGYRFQVTENAAEIALEHHLGLTCDPVGGFVQIPCIERNAMGAVKAYNAFLLASLGDPSRHKVGLDAAIRAMAQTGRDMSAKYKETSLGGLAVSVPKC